MKKLFSIVVIAILSLGIAKAQTVLFSEDFNSGINPAWTNGGTAANGANPWVKWRYTHSGSHGAYGTATDFINSPTKANGFIIFDSDSLDNGGHTLPSGQPDITGGPANAPQHVELTSNAIPLAGNTYCKLSFYQYCRVFQNTVTIVGISTDGINFINDTINTNLAVNAATPSNSKISIDMSPILNTGGAHPNVYIRITMDATY